MRKYTVYENLGNRKLGTLEISDDNMYRWTTSDDIETKAPALFDNMLMFGSAEKEWIKPFGTFKKVIPGAFARGIYDKIDDHAGRFTLIEKS